MPDRSTMCLGHAWGYTCGRRCEWALGVHLWTVDVGVNAFFQHERNYHAFYMLCYYKHKQGAKDKKGRPIDNSDAETMLGPKAFKHCKQVKEYDCLARDPP